MRRWEDSIKRDGKEIDRKSVDWIQLAYDKIQCLAVLNIIINLRFPQKERISSVDEQMLASQEGLYSMELIS